MRKIIKDVQEGTIDLVFKDEGISIPTSLRKDSTAENGNLDQLFVVLCLQHKDGIKQHLDLPDNIDALITKPVQIAELEVVLKNLGKIRFANKTISLEPHE